MVKVDTEPRTLSTARGMQRQVAGTKHMSYPSTGEVEPAGSVPSRPAWFA